LASGACAAQRDVDEHLREAHDEKRAVEALLARARADAARHPFHPSLRSGPPPQLRRDGGLVFERALAGDHSLEVPGLEARLALTVREVERLMPRATAARARATTAGRLAERAAAWVKEAEPAALVEAVACIRREAAAIRLPDDVARLPAELTRTRDEFVALDAERATLERAPSPSPRPVTGCWRWSTASPGTGVSSSPDSSRRNSIRRPRGRSACSPR